MISSPSIARWSWNTGSKPIIKLFRRSYIELLGIAFPVCCLRCCMFIANSNKLLNTDKQYLLFFLRSSRFCSSRSKFGLGSVRCNLVATIKLLITYHQVFPKRKHWYSFRKDLRVKVVVLLVQLPRLLFLHEFFRLTRRAHLRIAILVFRCRLNSLQCEIWELDVGSLVLQISKLEKMKTLSSWSAYWCWKVNYKALTLVASSLSWRVSRQSSARSVSDGCSGLSTFMVCYAKQVYLLCRFLIGSRVN